MANSPTSSISRVIADGTARLRRSPSLVFRASELVIDASGFYRTGVTQYNLVGGPRISTNLGKWRPFAHAMVGVRHLNSSGFTYNPLALDFGGGVDYKLPFKNFSWRFQGDYMHTHYLSATQNDYRASTGIVWRF